MNVVCPNPNRTIRVSRENGHSPSQRRRKSPATGSPSRDGPTRHARNYADDCGGRHLGRTNTRTVDIGSTGRCPKPLTDRAPIPFVRPLLGNKGVNSLSGSVNKSGSTLNGNSTRKQPTYKFPCKTCGKRVKSNQSSVMAVNFCTIEDICHQRKYQ